MTLRRKSAQLDADISAVLSKTPRGSSRAARLDADIAHALAIGKAQAYDSRATSRNQVPALFRAVPWVADTVNLDVGGGRFDRGTEYLAEQGVTSLVFDPFNRSEQHNIAVLKRVKSRRADTATIANVLNVIKEPGVQAFAHPS